MEEFIEKHQLDVGKTFGILIFSGMVTSIYEVIGDMLLANHLNLNVGIIVMYFLGRGMYRHNNTARKWCIGITIGATVLVSAIAIGSPFWSGATITIGSRETVDPPFWKTLIFVALIAPISWAALASLFSNRAKEEFGVVEPVVPYNSDQSLRD